MVIELRGFPLFRTRVGSRRQMVVDAADYHDTMQVPGGSQQAWKTLRDGCPDPPHPALEILQGKYLITWSTTVGDSNEKTGEGEGYADAGSSEASDKAARRTRREAAEESDLPR